MADVHDAATRSRNMAAIRGTDTKPERLLRLGLHALGFRYRLHDRSLPGRPDMVFPRWKAVIFVDGCFWHGHACHLFRWPGTRDQFWRDKIGSNVRRDEAVRQRLIALGWRVGDVWECTLRGKERLPVAEVLERCAAFLRGDDRQISIGSPDTVLSGDDTGAGPAGL